MDNKKSRRQGISRSVFDVLRRNPGILLPAHEIALETNLTDADVSSAISHLRSRAEMRAMIESPIKGMYKYNPNAKPEATPEAIPTQSKIFEFVGNSGRFTIVRDVDTEELFVLKQLKLSE